MAPVSALIESGARTPRAPRSARSSVAPRRRRPTAGARRARGIDLTRWPRGPARRDSRWSSRPWEVTSEPGPASDLLRYQLRRDRRRRTPRSGRGRRCPRRRGPPGEASAHRERPQHALAAPDPATPRPRSGRPPARRAPAPHARAALLSKLAERLAAVQAETSDVACSSGASSRRGRRPRAPLRSAGASPAAARALAEARRRPQSSPSPTRPAALAATWKPPRNVPACSRRVQRADAE